MSRPQSKRSAVMRTTVFLMVLTIASKLIGFVRELILLGSVGIGLELDLFVVLFGITTVITGALGICIVTSVTPLAVHFRGPSGAIALMKEGITVGVLVWAAATLSCVAYVLFAREGLVGSGILLALLVPGVVPFGILAEYQVGLFLARDQRTPVIGGNIIISLPLAVALLLFDLGIVAYAAGLVASFALRSIIFAWLLVRDRDERGQDDEARPAVSLFRVRFGKTIAGGSAMLATSTVYVSATVFAQQFGEGAATLIAYGLKIPLFFLTSAWFVLGTGYFADLVQSGGRRPVRNIVRLSAINLVLLVAAAGAIVAVRLVDGARLPWLPGNSADILEVFRLSLPFLPLILFVPVIEMVQRLAVTRERHFAVLAITGAIFVGGSASQIGSVLFGSRQMLFVSPAFATGLGATAAILVLWRLRHSEGALETQTDDVSKGTQPL